MYNVGAKLLLNNCQFEHFNYHLLKITITGSNRHYYFIGSALYITSVYLRIDLMRSEQVVICTTVYTIQTAVRAGNI